MIDTLKLKRLSARNTNVRFNSKMNLSYKLKNEHVFSSISECLEYLEYIIYNKSLNPDDLFFDNYKDLGVLYANIIDESICSIIYEAYHLIYRHDDDMLAYSRNLVDQFQNKLNNYILHSTVPNSQLLVFKALLQCLSVVSILLNPTDSREEINCGDLALYYYNLLYTTYSYLSENDTEEDQYFSKQRNIYAQYIMYMYKEHTRMGTLESYFQGAKYHNE